MDGLQPLIAIVDDEECVRKALERLLRAAGIATETYPSGEAFLQAMESRVADCVLLDLHMPGLSGFDVLAATGKTNNRLPVIVLTGQDTPASRRQALEGGACFYLTKPVDEPELLDAIEQVLPDAAFLGRP